MIIERVCLGSYVLFVSFFFFFFIKVSKQLVYSTFHYIVLFLLIIPVTHGELYQLT